MSEQFVEAGLSAFGVILVTALVVTAVLIAAVLVLWTITKKNDRYGGLFEFLAVSLLVSSVVSGAIGFIWATAGFSQEATHSYQITGEVTNVSEVPNNYTLVTINDQNVLTLDKSAHLWQDQTVTLTCDSKFICNLKG